jgi:hypothetical protein
MKKSILLLAMTMLTLLLPGCIDEQNLDKCPMDVTLTFDYLENGVDRFGRDINTVDVFIFDANGVFLFTQRVNKSELNAFQGVHLSLLPGDYQVVCWANVTDHSVFSNLVPGVTTIEEAYIQISSTATGDALYFAPGAGSGQLGDNTLHVEPQESTTKNMDFVRAYRRINVYIKGIEYTQNGSVNAPSVDANHLWSMYSFGESPSNKMNLTQNAVYTSTDDGMMYLASFYSDLGVITTDMEIVVTNALGQVVATINLWQYLAEHPGMGSDDIDILITFTLLNNGLDLGVSITVPNWGSVIVKPNL